MLRCFFILDSYLFFNVRFPSLIFTFVCGVRWSMNVLCYNMEDSLTESLAVRLLPQGFTLYPAYDDSDWKRIIRSRRFYIVIADISCGKGREEINIPFLTWLDSVYGDNSLKRVVLSSVADEYNIRRLVEMGITSFVSKKNPTSVIIERVVKCVNKISETIPDSRKHVRVTPDESDNPSAVFYLGNDKITSKVANVSMGGVLLKIEGMGNLNQIKKDSSLSRIQMTLNNKKIISDAIVVAKKDNFLGLRYSSMSDAYKETLSKYIFKKLS